MLDWLPELARPALTTLLLLAAFFLPGTLALLPLKTGWPAAIALGPAVTLLLYMAGTFAAEALQLPWNPATAVGLAVPLVLLSWLIGRRYAFRTPLVPPGLPTSTKIAVGAGLAAGSALTGRALLRGIGSPGTASQGWDPIFHLNALRWIQESGNATPWGIAPIFGAGTPTYYPSGWHSTVALFPDVTAAANLSSIVIGAIIWPIGLAFLASMVLPRHPAVWALTPLLGASFVSFPFAQLLRSGQWPNGLATALVPATAAVAILLLRRLTSGERGSGEPAAGERGVPRRGEHILLGAICAAALGGCVAAHPSTIFATAVAVLPFVVAGLLPLFLRGLRRRPRLTGAATGAAVLAVALLYSALAGSKLLAGVMAYRRAVRAVIPDSLNLALFDLPQFPALHAPSPDDFNLVVGLLAIFGAVVAVFVKEARPLAVSWLAFVVLYVLAAGPENGFRWLTGFWYKDTQRIAPFIAMAGSILAALTIVVVTRAVIRAVSARLADAPASGRWNVPAALFIGCVVVISGAIYFSSAAYRSADRVAVAAQNYVVSGKPGDGVLSSGEQAFIQSAGAMLPADAVVIGDPFNGETYFYALTGRHVVYTQLGAPTASSAAKELLRTGFNRLHTDKSVCAALLKVGATHFYQDVAGGSHGSASLKRWPGFYNVSTEQGFEQVAAAGGRALYRITACR
jgi:hypothetical protein